MDTIAEPDEYLVALLALPGDFPRFTKTTIPDDTYERSIAYEEAIAALMAKVIDLSPPEHSAELARMRIERVITASVFRGQLKANRASREEQP